MTCPNCKAKMLYIADGLDKRMRPVKLWKCPKCGHRESRNA